jgi:hypothetical protein
MQPSLSSSGEMAATSNLFAEDIIRLFVVVETVVQLKTVIPQGCMTALLVRQRGCYQFKMLALSANWNNSAT